MSKQKNLIKPKVNSKKTKQKNNTDVNKFWDIKFSAIVSTAVLIVLSIQLFYLKCQTDEINKQTQLWQLIYKETLKPYILCELDSNSYNFYYYGLKEEGIPEKSFITNISFKNIGSTPSKLVGLTYIPSSYSETDFNIRDTLLINPGKFAINENKTRISSFIPPQEKYKIAQRFDNILAQVNVDGSFYIHILIIYKDIFNNYFDTYCTYKFAFNYIKMSLNNYTPTYNFYQYNKEQIRFLVDKNIISNIDTKRN